MTTLAPNQQPIIQRFDPPGGLTDFETEEEKNDWNNKLNKWFAKVMTGKTQENDGPRLQFFNPTITIRRDDLISASVNWTGFPKIVKINYPNDRVRWTVADGSRDVQDEYCEWSVERNGERKITKITFTCEGPEYWKFLAEKKPNKVLALYQQYVNAAIKREDLFDQNGQYIVRNKWNNSTTNGAMHLIQVNNTLNAEVELAAAATIVRKKPTGEIITEQDELIRCSQYGHPQRNSDPHIGSSVNGLARQKLQISFENPVGLYFDVFDPPGEWTGPEENIDPKDFWRIERGTAERPVRAVFEIKDRDYVVGDIKVNGKPIEFAGQIADFVKVKLTAIAQGLESQDKYREVIGCRTRSYSYSERETSSQGKEWHMRFLPRETEDFFALKINQ